MSLWLAGMILRFAGLLLRLRYRIRVSGLDAIAARGVRGIVFLPNHPALIDPIIMITTLFPRFRPRALADRDQVDRPGVRWMARTVGVQPLPDLNKHGPGVKAEREAAVARTIAAVRDGANLLVYPSGAIYRSRFEDLRGNNAVELLLRDAPLARIVLVRTRGLWGSRFGMAERQMPNPFHVLRSGVGALLSSFIFFMPRRDVTIELFEPPNLPRSADRATLNTFIEAYYNQDAPPARYVPYSLWERGGPREMPEPAPPSATASADDVPAATRALVSEYLMSLCGATALRDEDHLARDLGLDSLARTELMLWLGREFGFAGADVDAIQTVADALLAARGQAVASRQAELKAPPRSWFLDDGPARVDLRALDSVNAAFLATAKRAPGRVAVADQLSGAKRYRDLITSIFVLKPWIESMPGAGVGIMLPASVTADTVYLATLFAGKTPVMINWTTGARNVAHGLELAQAQRVITSSTLVARIESQGADFAAVRERFAFLEPFGKQVSRWTKLCALLRSYCSWGQLRRAEAPPYAAILFTSGSEALPKAAPLTHANVLTNVRDVADGVQLSGNDRMLGFLPPFHSFGLTVTLIAPLVLGIRLVHHANPTEAWMLARLVDAYLATILLGTPTFLSGLLRVARADQLSSLRLVVTGAEKCPARLYEQFAAMAPSAQILEGYGVTECSPIVTANMPGAIRPGSIGKPLASVELALVDVDSEADAAPDSTGMLLVRGPSVFPGYLGSEVASPFVQHGGRSWYRTGDLVYRDRDGFLFFRGRLKRFVKLGGEMISLPAIEAALESALAREGDEGPVLAVEAAPAESNPELVLFTIRDLDRQGANRIIRDAGLSPLHNISRVERVESIPALGTGKTDYRALRALLEHEPLARGSRGSDGATP